VTHLDTSFLVDLLREASDGLEGPANGLLEDLAEEELAISVHVACELFAGVELSRDPVAEHDRVQTLCRSLPVVFPDERFAPMYGEIYGELRRRGESVTTMDLLIATSARVENARLVTRIVRDFERIPGLHVLSY
jgi:predicted nucleic acid-binding protein